MPLQVSSPPNHSANASNLWADQDPCDGEPLEWLPLCPIHLYTDLKDHKWCSSDWHDSGNGELEEIFSRWSVHACVHTYTHYTHTYVHTCTYTWLCVSSDSVHDYVVVGSVFGAREERPGEADDTGGVAGNGKVGIIMWTWLSPNHSVILCSVTHSSRTRRSKCVVPLPPSCFIILSLVHHVF